MTQLNEDIKSLDPCPPEEFLRAYATGMLKDRSLQSVILSHLEFCPSCKQQVREFKRSASSDGDPIAKRAKSLRERQMAQQRAVAQGPTPGTIWRTVPESENDPSGPLVLVIDKQEAKEGATLTVADVSEEIGQAIHTDMVLEPKESGLGFRCMIRSGNTFKISPDRLTFFAGALSQALKDKVSGFCKDAERFDENIPLSKFVFLKDSKGTELMRRGGITSGVLVTDDSDPRLEFLELSQERCSYLSGKSATTGKSGSKVITLPSRRPLVRKILALAAVLAVIVVGLKGSEIVLDRSMDQLRSEHAKQVEELKGQFATTAEEKAKELAGLNQSGETLKSKITALEGQNARLKTDMDKMAASIVQTENAAVREAESLKNKMAEIEREKEELIKRNAALAASNHEATQQLAEAREAVQRLETRIARESEPPKFAASSEVVPIDPRKGKAVLQAAKSGDPNALRSLVKDWRWADFADEKTGTRPLHVAALNGNLPVMQFLLDKGAGIDSSDKEGKTALMLAATKGHGDAVKLLMQRGADVHLCDAYGKTTLYWALENGHKELAQDLRFKLGFYNW